MLKRSRLLFLSLCIICSLLWSAMILPAGNIAFADAQTVSNPPIDNPTFSWDNANVYFVMTDRFYNGNTSNDSSYGRPRSDTWGKISGPSMAGTLKV